MRKRAVQEENKNQKCAVQMLVIFEQIKANNNYSFLTFTYRYLIVFYITLEEDFDVNEGNHCLNHSLNCNNFLKESLKDFIEKPRRMQSCKNC